MESNVPRLSFDQELHFSSGSGPRKLCDICSSMTVAVLRSQDGFNHRAHAFNLQEEHDSETGCPLCSLMWTRVLEKRQSSMETIRSGWGKRPSLQDPIKLFSNPKGPSEIQDGLRWLQIFCAPAAVLALLHWKRSQKTYGIQEAVRALMSRRDREFEAAVAKSRYWKVDIKISTDHGRFSLEVQLSYDSLLIIKFEFIDSEAAHLVTYKRVISEPNSDKVFRHLDSWIDDCLQNHAECTNTIRAFLPTRLIDLGTSDGSQDPFLVITREITHPSGSADAIRYTALSYCWGLEHCAAKLPLTTTSLNIEDRKKGIAMETLPLSIRDAITITRRLGIQYIWVDALCILQGDCTVDRADWSEESVKMADVYGGAFLTIAAASARSMHDGILYPREFPDNSLTELFLESKDSAGMRGRVFIGSTQPFLESMDEPLYHRGWTLQERILSPRVLICKKDQFAWECQSGTATESGVEMHGIGETRLQMTTKNESLGRISELGEWLPDLAWQCIMTDYSARSLSRSSDKLIAIAGLAKEFAAIHGRTEKQYLAGLWTTALLDDLLWAHEAIKIGQQQKRGKPVGYRAPSWSWAALDGNVRWLRANYIGQGNYCTRIEGTHVDNVSGQPFGEVSAGYITLRGPLRRLESAKVKLRFDSSVSILRIEATNCTISGFDVHLDASIEAGLSEIEYTARRTNSLDIWLLQIKKGASLVLTPVEFYGSNAGGMTFRRVGVAFPSGAADIFCFKDSEETRITIF